MEYDLGQHGKTYWTHKILELIDCINLLSSDSEQIDKDDVKNELLLRTIDYHVSTYYMYVKRHQDRINEYAVGME